MLPSNAPRKLHRPQGFLHVPNSALIASSVYLTLFFVLLTVP